MFNRLRPHADKCLGMVMGNHEDSLVLKTTINPTRQFCNDNKITYMGAVGRLIFKNGNKKASMVVTHGSGGGGQIGGPLNRAIAYAKTFNADVVCMGHHHKLATACDLKSYEDEEGKLHWKPMKVILNGSAVESYGDGGYGTYAERKMMQPSALGYTILTFDKDLNVAVEQKAY